MLVATQQQRHAEADDLIYLGVRSASRTAVLLPDATS